MMMKKSTQKIVELISTMTMQCVFHQKMKTKGGRRNILSNKEGESKDKNTVAEDHKMKGLRIKLTQKRRSYKEKRSQNIS